MILDSSNQLLENSSTRKFNQKAEYRVLDTRQWNHYSHTLIRLDNIPVNLAKLSTLSNIFIKRSFFSFPLRINFNCCRKKDRCDKKKNFLLTAVETKNESISISGETQSKQIARRFMATCFPITNATFLIVKRFSKSIFFSIKPSLLQLELRRYGGRVCSFILLEFQQYIFLKFNWRLLKKLLSPCFFRLSLILALQQSRI